MMIMMETQLSYRASKCLQKIKKEEKPWWRKAKDRGSRQYFWADAFTQASQMHPSWYKEPSISYFKRTTKKPNFFGKPLSSRSFQCSTLMV